MFKKVSAATSSFFKPSPADEGRSTFAASFSAGKRRAFQSIGGASKATPDEEYIARRQRLDTLRKHLAALIKAASAHVDAMRSLAFTATEMGESASDFLGDAVVSDPRGASIETWARPLAGLDASMASRDVHRLVETVIQPLQAELAHIDGDVAAKARERELVKLDYDARLLKVTSMKEKGTGGDPAALLHKEEKLARTSTELQRLTAETYTLFDEVEARRCAAIPPILNAFSACFRDEAAVLTESAAALPLLPHMTPPPRSVMVPVAQPAVGVVAGTTGGAGLGAGTGGMASVLPAGGGGAAYGQPSQPGIPAYAPAGGAPVGTATTAVTATASAPGGGYASSTLMQSPMGDTAAGRRLPPAPPAGTAAAGGAAGGGMMTQQNEYASGIAGGKSVPVAAAAPIAPIPPASRVGAPSAAAGGGGPVDGGGAMVRVTHPFAASQADELSVSPGELLSVTRRHADGWLEVANRKTGATGLVPENHTKAM